MLLLKMLLRPGQVGLNYLFLRYQYQSIIDSLQIGGGINEENAQSWLDKGASKV